MNLGVWLNPASDNAEWNVRAISRFATAYGLHVMGPADFATIYNLKALK